MFDQLVSGFGQSKQGHAAMQALAAQGIAGPHAQSILSTAIPAAAHAMQSAAKGDKKALPGVGDSNYVMNFTAAAVSGLIRGSGFMGSAIDGFQGIVGGYVAQVIAARFGLPKRTAGVIGAVITPLAIDFLWEKLEQSKANAQAQAQPQAPPLPQAVPALPPPTHAGYGYGYVQHQHAAAQHYAGAPGYGGGHRYVPGQGYAAGQGYAGGHAYPQQGYGGYPTYPQYNPYARR